MKLFKKGEQEEVTVDDNFLVIWK